ncbi:MAG: leucine-rich repeat protein [Ruminococcus sp.]|nr:leucine-rich repeat protein [Ruminococcus sp.]
MKRKSMLNRVLSCILALLMLISAMPLMSVSAEIESVIGTTDEGLEYEIYNGEVTIIGCDAEVTECTIPDTIDGHPVAFIGESAFYSCSSLKSITIPSSVTSIGEYAFRECSSLKNIYIPEGVTYIGYRAFGDCESLESVTIPNSIEKVEYIAFENTAIYNNESNWENGVLYIGPVLIDSIYGDYDVKNIYGNYVIKAGTKVIADYAMAGCSIESVTIPSSVTHIGDYAFRNCSSLESVTIPSRVTSIGDSVFDGCSSLASINVEKDNSICTSVDGVLFSRDMTTLIKYPANKTAAKYSIPEGVTEIVDGAFGDCRNLQNLTVSGSVETLYGISGCDSLLSVTILEGVKSIGSYCFYDCSSLESVTIPSSVASICGDAFDYCGSFESFIVDKDNSNYTSVDGVLFSKDMTTLIKYPVNKAGETYTIPEGVTSIESGAISDCQNLQNIIIPGSVESLTGFDGIQNLVSVTIGEGVKSIGENCFYNCSSLESVIIPSSVTSIGDSAFYSCESLTSITIPDSIEKVGQSAFYDTAIYNDESNWKDGVLYIGAVLVKGSSKKGLSGNYTVNEGTKVIAEYAMSGCNIDGITIPNSVRHIGDRAFFGCEILQSVSISDSVIEVGSQAFDFSGYYNEESNWDGDFLYIDSVLVSSAYPAETIKNYAIKEGTRVIAENALIRAGSYLVSLTIPASTQYISPSDGYVDYSTEWGAGFDFRAYGVFGFGLNNLKEFVVNENNEALISIDGVLVDKKTSEILRYPAGAEATEYTVPDEITGVRGSAFVNVGFSSVIIPKSVTNIDEAAFQGPWYDINNLNNIIIYGYEASCAEAFANKNGIKFVAIKELTDEASDITVEFATNDEVVLKIAEITDTDMIGKINEELENQSVNKVYDITLTQGEETVQPDGRVTVKIPTDNENTTVYRVEENNTLTDMNAVHEDGYMVFTTDHFSLYVLVVDGGQETPPETSTGTTTGPSIIEPEPDMVLLGDADMSGKVNVKDSTIIQKAIASLVELSARETFAANVISSDVLNVKDATAIQKWIAFIPVDISINEYVFYDEGGLSPTDPEDTTDPTDSKDVAVISCGEETYTTKVGDTITYTVLLSADEKIENVQGTIRFDSTVLNPINNGLEDPVEFAYVHCPNLTDAMLNQDSDDSIIFMASDGYTGFDFENEKILVTYSFVVSSAEETGIGFDIDFMTIFGGEDYYFDYGEAIITDGITLAEVITVS